MRSSTCCARVCLGAICRNATGLTQQPTIGSTAGLAGASGSASSTSWHRNLALVSDRQHDRESPPLSQRRKRGEKNQAIGISRGGRTTKIHAIVDSKGRPLNFTVTGGQVHDSQVVEDVLDTPKQPLAVTGDKAYDSQRARQQIKDEGALPVIPSRSNATRKAYCPRRFYRQRHKIENFFCRIKDWRRIATRYDKLARNFLAATTLVGVLYWIKL